MRKVAQDGTQADLSSAAAQHRYPDPEVVEQMLFGSETLLCLFNLIFEYDVVFGVSNVTAATTTVTPGLDSLATQDIAPKTPHERYHSLTRLRLCSH